MSHTRQSTLTQFTNWNYIQQRPRLVHIATFLYKAATYFNEEYGVSAGALRTWASFGRLEHIRMPGGKRMYDVDGVKAILGQRLASTRTSYIYARVSSRKQQGDLARQIEDLQKAYPGYTLIKDVASGGNFRRKGLQTLLGRVLDGVVKEVVVAHRDRLARIGCDLLEFIIDKAGIKLVIFGQHDGDDENDLADDLLAVTTLLVASHNGRRAAENRKRRRKEEAQSSGSKSEEGGEEGSSDGGDREASSGEEELRKPDARTAGAPPPHH